jgi:hypothetical protein
MGYPTQGQTHNLVTQLEKQLEIADNEIASIKSLVVRQNTLLKELLQLIKKIDQTVEHDVTHR